MVTVAETEEIIGSYLRWLKEGLSWKAIGDATEVTTPFLDRHNDHLQVYVQRLNGKIVLSDDGYIMSDLLASGLEFNTEKRRDVLETALRGFGVRLHDKELLVEASRSNIGQKMHSLVQAMVAVNDMFVMAQSRVASFFFEDVKLFFDTHDVRYIERVKLTGTSGFDHAIDFVVPRSDRAPERLVQAINSPTKSMVTSYLFSVTDTRPERPQAQSMVVLNDEDQNVGASVVEALEAYDVLPIPWTMREEYIERLAS